MNQESKIEVLGLDIFKYPRTPHMESSRLQKGDEGHDQIPYARYQELYSVIEEKFDGGNAGISFTPAADMLLQSRGHYLTGGGRERQFNLFKQWATAHESWLLERLEDRYVLYGEWLHKKHAMYYDRLPHYFLEFDVLDKHSGRFLTTQERHRLLAGGPVMSVPVLHAGVMPKKLADLWKLVKPSLGRSLSWRENFEHIVRREGLELSKAWEQCDGSDLSEGLYGKVEEGGVLSSRYKLVRPDFVQAILESEVHHAEQPFIPNMLHPDVDIYSPTLTVTWQQIARERAEESVSATEKEFFERLAGALESVADDAQGA